MPNFFADLASSIASTIPTAPQTRVGANKHGGTMRTFEATYIVPTPAPIIGDKLIWGKLPVRSRMLGHLGLLSWSAGSASSTLNVGDGAGAARHLAATAVASAGSAVPQAAITAGASFETTDDTASATNGFVSTADNCTLVSTVAGAALLAGQRITLRMPYVQN